MNLRPILLASAIAFGSGVLAQCTEPTANKVLLVGDSWAFFMGVDGTLNTLLERWGHSNFRFYTNATIAENGAETDDFQTPAKQAEIQARIDADPDISVVHLSLGGNDVLGDWNVDFTPAQTDSLKAAVEERLLDVIDFVKNTRPGMRVLWSGYMYPNFGEVISELGPLQSIHPFYGTWSGMGFPSFEQLNTILNDFSATLEQHASNDPQLDFVNATGLMQHTFGQNTPLGVAPGGSYPPLTAPLPLGYVDYPSPMASMRNYGLFLDCFHLSASGYRDMIDEHMRKFYHKFLMSDQYLLSAGGTQDGAVSNTGTVVPELLLGEQDGERYSTVLTFNTADMEGATLDAASLFLRREGLSGNNPVGGTLEVKVKTGAFGGDASVEAVDYYAPADALADACRFGSTAGNGHWIRLDLPEQLLPYITDQTTTQFIISAPDALGGVVTFTGATDPELAPVLNLTFGELTVSAGPEPDGAPAIRAYPNPTHGPLTLDHPMGSVVGVTVRDLLGREVLRPAAQGTTIDLSPLPAGTYLVLFPTGHGMNTQRVVKW